jgi:hypothetical protein
VCYADGVQIIIGYAAQPERRTVAQNQDDLRGTTLNERLYLRGLLDEFDSALAHRDRERLIELLEEVEIRGSNAEQAVDEVLKHRTDDRVS